jgi:hypothetical protein
MPRKGMALVLRNELKTIGQSSRGRRALTTQQAAARLLRFRRLKARGG